MFSAARWTAVFLGHLINIQFLNLSLGGLIKLRLSSYIITHGNFCMFLKDLDRRYVVLNQASPTLRVCGK